MTETARVAPVDTTPPTASDAVGLLPVVSRSFGVRYVEFLEHVTADDSVTVAFDGTVLTLHRDDVRIATIADRCGVSSAGSAGRWRPAWMAEGWLTKRGAWWDFHLDTFAVPLPKNVTPIGPIQSSPPDGPSERTAVRRSPGDDLADVHTEAFAAIVTAYAAAVEADDPAADELAAAISRLNRARFAPTVSAFFADPGPASRNETSQVSSYAREERREAVEPRAKTDRPRETTARKKRKSSGGRTVVEMERLVGPLTEACTDLGLPGVTNPHGVVKAIADYDDDTVAAAAASFARQLRAQPGKVNKPVGVFITQAYDRGEHFTGTSEWSGTQTSPSASATGTVLWEREDGSIFDPMFSETVDPAGYDNPTIIPEPGTRAAAEAEVGEWLASKRGMVGHAVFDLFAVRYGPDAAAAVTAEQLEEAGIIGIQFWFDAAG